MLLETATTSEAREWTYTYDSKGNQLTAEIPGGAEWDYTYNSLNRLTKSMIIMEYATGFTINYERNADGQLTAIRQGMATLAAYTYDIAGRRASRTLSNGLITGYTYNVRGELTSAAIGDGTNLPLWRNDYGYNTVGNRTWTRYGDSSALGDAYTYDATDQVTGVKYNAESVSSGYASAANATFAALWTYDAAGNRITEAVSGTAIPARPAATAYTTNDINQYTGLVEDSVTRSLSYSARSDLATWNGWTLSYDSFGRLRKANDGSVTHWHQYDGEGRRIGKKINGTQEWLLHEGYDLIESHKPVSGDTVSYIYEDGIDQSL